MDGKGIGWTWFAGMIIAATLALIGVMMMFIFGDCDKKPGG